MSESGSDWSGQPGLKILHEMLRGIGALTQVAGVVWFGYGVALVAGLREGGLHSPSSWLSVVAGLATTGWGLVVTAHAAILRLLSRSGDRGGA
jgi:hypothetical protein